MLLCNRTIGGFQLGWKKGGEACDSGRGRPKRPREGALGLRSAAGLERPGLEAKAGRGHVGGGFLPGESRVLGWSGRSALQKGPALVLKGPGRGGTASSPTRPLPRAPPQETAPQPGSHQGSFLLLKVSSQLPSPTRSAQ